MKFSISKLSHLVSGISSQKIDHIFAYTIIAYGGFLRIYAFSSNRSLWLDEAMIALNIINKTYLELTKVLDYNQSAPIGFLWVEKVMASLHGNTDLLLRFLPLMAGIVSMWLMWILGKKYFDRFFALIPLILFIINDRLVYYSSEVKQYSFDVLATLILLIFTITYFESQKKLIRGLIFGIIGALVIWFSHPAIFILGSVGCALIFDNFLRRDKTGILLSIGIIALWLVSFSLEYIVSLRGIALQKGLNSYWSAYFMPIPPWSNPHWFISAWKDLIFFLGYKNNVFVVGVSILLLLGVLSVTKKNLRNSFLILIPFLLIFLASGIEKYPFFRRLLLFIFPILFILITAGVERVYLFLSSRKKYYAWVSTFLLLLYLICIPGLTSIDRINHPIQKENTKALLTFLQSEWEDNDIVYVHYSSKPAFLYYSEQFGFTDGEYSLGIRSKDKPKLYKGELDRLKDEGRIWLIFSHQTSEFVSKDKSYILKYMRTKGKQVYSLAKENASLYLFDVSTSQ